MPKLDEYVRIAEAAEYIGVHHNTLRKRRELYDAQDAIDRDRDELIAKIEKQLSTEQTLHPLFTVRWHVR